MSSKELRKHLNPFFPSYLWRGAGPEKKPCHLVKAEGRMDLNLRNLPWKRWGALTSTRLGLRGVGCALRLDSYREAIVKNHEKCGFDSIDYSLFTTFQCQVIFCCWSYRKKTSCEKHLQTWKHWHFHIFLVLLWFRAWGSHKGEPPAIFFCETGRHGCKAPSKCCRIVRHLTPVV